MSFRSLQLACCGVRELEGLSAYSKSMHKLLYDFEQLYYKPNKECIDGNCRFRYLVFTCINDKTYGTELQDFILTNGLGSVIKTDKNLNPNSGNLVQVFIWTVDHVAVRKWLKNNPNKQKDTNNGQGIQSQAAAGAALTATCGDPNCLTCYGQRVVQQAQGVNPSSTSRFGGTYTTTIGGNNSAGQQQR